MFWPALLIGSETPTEFANSIGWNASNASLDWTAGATGDQKTWTVSIWFRLLDTGSVARTIWGVRDPDEVNHVGLFLTTGNSIASRAMISGSSKTLNTSAEYKDLNAWTHVVVAMDTTQVTDTDRHKLWVNGELITQFSTEVYPAQNSNTTATAYIHKIGRWGNDANMEGEFAIFHYLDGVVADADDFGELVNGVWVPKAYSGSYGAQGHRLDFSDPADLGADTSGNGNDWTLTNLSSANSRKDGPSEAYAFPNKYFAGNHTSWTEGLTRVAVSSGAFETIRSDILLPPSGKWYWECTAIGTPDGTNVPRVGIVGEAEWDEEQGIQASAYGYCYRRDGVAENNSVSKGYGDGYTINDVIGVAYDAAAGKLEFFLNGVSQGEAYTDLEGWFYPAVSCGTAFIWEMNFGQLAFSHSAPQGYRSVSARNMPHSDAPAPAQTCVSATDTGAAIEATLAALRPSWGAYIDIYKNRSSAEDWEVRFSDDGDNSVAFNTDAAKAAKATLVGGDNYVGVSIAVSSNTGVYSAEVIHQVGVETTVDHGIACDSGEVAAIVKRVDSTGDWFVSHPGVTPDRVLKLNSDAIQTFDPDKVIVSGKTVKIGRLLPSGTYRVLVFAEKFGAVRITKHTGNGVNSPGPYIWSGFETELFIVKELNVVRDWMMYTSSVTGFNPRAGADRMNSDAVFVAANPISFTSGAVVIETTDARLNTNNQDYVTIMFAAVPYGAINGHAANGVL